MKNRIFENLERKRCNCSRGVKNKKNQRFYSGKLRTNYRNSVRLLGVNKTIAIVTLFLSGASHDKLRVLNPRDRTKRNYDVLFSSLCWSNSPIVLELYTVQYCKDCTIYTYVLQTVDVHLWISCL